MFVCIAQAGGFALETLPTIPLAELRTETLRSLCLSLQGPGQISYLDVAVSH